MENPDLQKHVLEISKEMRQFIESCPPPFDTDSLLISSNNYFIYKIAQLQLEINKLNGNHSKNTI